jgi:hypothetical protein
MGAARKSDAAKERRASRHKTKNPLQHKANTETVTPSAANPFATFLEWSSEADEEAYRSL